jgi:hypothetical protein
MIASPASAQLNGHNTLGDFGLLAGTQPAPGFYASAFYYRYSSDTIRNRLGDRITLDPGERGDITISALAPFVWYVSDFKILGANYSAVAALPLVNATLEAPIFGFQQETGTDFGDLWVQPVNLGWHTPRADFLGGFGFYAPTGTYEPFGDNNTGLGMWSFELFAGTTVYIDEEKSWSFATNAFWETHTSKEDTDIQVGDTLTLEGGFGKSYYEGALNLGVAYYAQWKLTDDDLGLGLPGIVLPLDVLLEKHRTFGIGPDVTVPIATSSKLIALVNVRYFWEFGVRSKTDGSSLVITATFPIPSVAIE